MWTPPAEVEVDAALIEKLLHEQFPAISAAVRIAASGWDNVIARVGDDLCGGDPATDLAIAWLAFGGVGRTAFRAAAASRHPLGDPVWDRALAWAISLGLLFMVDAERERWRTASVHTSSPSSGSAEPLRDAVCRGESTGPTCHRCLDLRHNVLPLADRKAATSPVVDVTPMSQSHQDHQEHVVFDGVDDAVVADADAKPWSAPKGLCTRWARIGGEQGDGALDAAAGLRIELTQRPCGRRAKLKVVCTHSQPRSALTCSHGMFGPSSAIAASNAATSSLSSSAVISCS